MLQDHDTIHKCAICGRKMCQHCIAVCGIELGPPFETPFIPSIFICKHCPDSKFPEDLVILSTPDPQGNPLFRMWQQHLQQTKQEKRGKGGN